MGLFTLKNEDGVVVYDGENKSDTINFVKVYLLIHKSRLYHYSSGKFVAKYGVNPKSKLPCLIVTKGERNNYIDL